MKKTQEYTRMNRCGDGWEPEQVQGYPVTLDFGIEAFMTRDQYNSEWEVIDLESQVRLATGSSQKQAIANANESLKQYGFDFYQKCVANALQQFADCMVA